MTFAGRPCSTRGWGIIPSLRGSSAQKENGGGGGGGGTYATMLNMLHYKIAKIVRTL